MIVVLDIFYGDDIHAENTWRQKTVEARKRRIENYVSPPPQNRDCFQHWLRGVRDQEAKDAIRIRLNRVAEGNFGSCRPVGGGVHELKIPAGQGYRVYFGEDGDTVVLLGGSRKDDQEIQIKIAKERWNEYNA
jgi:putative addiction module killer protein